MGTSEPLTGSHTERGALKAAASLGQAHLKSFLERLESLYARMDRRYQEMAEKVGFHCQGCKENCCKTTFYHHTLVEYLYIRDGIFSLDKEMQAKLLRLSQEVSANPNTGRFCPLNQEGRCLLYTYRPMICRLHGLAHELRRPDGSVQRGPGCSAFDAAASGKPDIALNRTDLYWELSKLEQETRTALGFSGKIKMTLSQMVEAMLHGHPS